MVAFAPGAAYPLRLAGSRLRQARTSKDFGAIGDRLTDDTALLAQAVAAVAAFGELDLRGATYRITAPIPRGNVGIKIRNGRIRLDNPAAAVFYAFVASDYAKFEDIYFLGSGAIGAAGAPRYQGAIFGGNTGYAGPLGVAPANGVEVTGCVFEALTVGVWSGGSSLDPVPTGWSIHNNGFLNIVGFRGQSEGYGVLLTPCSYSTVEANNFTDIARHAIYLASEASYNVVARNTVRGCDNVAIQSNTYPTQNFATGNQILDNTISGLTRSIAYGYRSSIGIGIYGKHRKTWVSGNTIEGARDTGIDFGCERDGVAYGDAATVTNNTVTMDTTATDSAIRLDGLLSGVVQGNALALQSAIYGVTVTSTIGTGTGMIGISDNPVTTTVRAAVAFRVALSAARNVRVFRNSLKGFANANANRVYDTSTAGNVLTDLNAN